MSDPSVSFYVPGLRLVSEANVASHGHWRARHRRTRDQRAVVTAFLQTHGGVRPRVQLPARVTLVRVAPRMLDPDNAIASFKAIIDAVAAWLGVDDRSPALRRRYGQRQGDPKEYGLLVALDPLARAEDAPLLELMPDKRRTP